MHHIFFVECGKKYDILMLAGLVKQRKRFHQEVDFRQFLPALISGHPDGNGLCAVFPVPAYPRGYSKGIPYPVDRG